MKSTYKITITSSDSFGLDKSEWDVSIKKGTECPYQVNIDIKCQCKENWAYYTIRIEDGEANV